LRRIEKRPASPFLVPGTVLGQFWANVCLWIPRDTGSIDFPNVIADHRVAFERVKNTVIDAISRLIGPVNLPTRDAGSRGPSNPAPFPAV
jgi:hypothetical protein